MNLSADNLASLPVASGAELLQRFAACAWRHWDLTFPIIDKPGAYMEAAFDRGQACAFGVAPPDQAGRWLVYDMTRYIGMTAGIVKPGGFRDDWRQEPAFYITHQAQAAGITPGEQAICLAIEQAAGNAGQAIVDAIESLELQTSRMADALEQMDAPEIDNQALDAMANETGRIADAVEAGMKKTATT